MPPTGLEIIVTNIQHPDADTARNITESIKASLRLAQVRLGQVQQHVAEAHAMGAHRLLGYRDWAAYCEAEFGYLRESRLELEERRELHVALTAAGFSYREAAAVTGHSVGTVHSDRARSAVGGAVEVRTPGQGRPRKVLVRPWAARHFGRTHPLRAAAATFCAEAGHGNTRLKGPCGECWELAVRMDEITSSATAV